MVAVGNRGGPRHLALVRRADEGGLAARAVGVRRLPPRRFSALISGSAFRIRRDSHLCG